MQQTYYTNLAAHDPAVLPVVPGWPITRWDFAPQNSMWVLCTEFCMVRTRADGFSFYDTSDKTEPQSSALASSMTTTV
eukprot:2176472-Pleurochrysis_carterae.AAC.1